MRGKIKNYENNFIKQKELTLKIYIYKIAY